MSNTRLIEVNSCKECPFVEINNEYEGTMDPRKSNLFRWDCSDSGRNINRNVKSWENTIDGKKRIADFCTLKKKKE